MARYEHNGTLRWRLREPRQQLWRWFGWFLCLAVITASWQFISQATTWIFVLDAPAQGLDIAERMVPPRWSYLEKLWKPPVGHHQHRHPGHPAGGGGGPARRLSGRA